MSQGIEMLKESLVERVVEMAHQRLDPAAGNAAERLLRAYYAGVAAEDMLSVEPEDLYAAAMSLLAFARQRHPGQPKLRIHHPSSDEGGWSGDHSVIEIINDDMPFLVDSLTNALQKAEIAVHLAVHPIVPVRRDAQGRLQDILDRPQSDSRLESMMHIEIDRQSADGEAAVAGRLMEVLADVKSAVDDWEKMRDRLSAVMGALENCPADLPAEESAEGRAFLQWLFDDQFTFLGFRSMDFTETGGIRIDPASGLGLLRAIHVRVLDESRDLTAMPDRVRVFLRQTHLLLVTKGERISSVHRPVPLDVVGIKRFGADGRVVGMDLLVGLFTAAAYTRPPQMIPLLRQKVARIVEAAGLAQSSHDGRALLAILENYPRDELIQADPQNLLDTALAILRLQERQRVAVFARRDEFERFISVLVFIPRDRYDTRLRLHIQQELEQAWQAHITTWYTQVADSPLARLHFILRTDPQVRIDVDITALELRIAEAARSWADRLQEALVAECGEDRGLRLYRRWNRSFPASYTESNTPRGALLDIERIEAAVDGMALHLFRPVESPDSEVRFKIIRPGQPVALSDVLPVFEHMGFRVISEIPHVLQRENEPSVWIHEFAMTTADGLDIDIGALRERFEQAFRAVMAGAAEDDGFNHLVVNAGLSWRQVVLLRAYSKYLRQAGSTFSQSYVERSVTANSAVAAMLIRLFEVRFDPAGPEEGEDIRAAIDLALEKISSADQERILRRFLNLIECTLRTNYFQGSQAASPKPYLSLKLDSRRIEGLPLPRPMVEIFVYSPQMEGIHLRGGRVARGGIRWSDRPEDFRTEVLGLMKAQMVKNAVIVPVGSKGGFVVKHPAKLRETFQEQGIACYRTLMRGLLDITDNLNSSGQVVPPDQVVRRDGDDPYLVVAADKGTASFSDIANGISADYGFWLGDAFASGGSRGYDHKVMAITARGAWESVKRHFREMGRDIQAEDFTVVGVGDMSGDVFGNGMLRSPHIRLVAAFDHRHIFIDPDPDPVRSFDERARLFALPRSSWADYDAALLSPGGGVYPRDAKHIALSPQAQRRFGLETAVLSPIELIRAVLKAPVDLLWFGGIGTYVKNSGEMPAEVGDRANDAVRVDGCDLRAKVVGEGANLGVTQRGRIEFAGNGGRINTDAIDNSAGVDCSDHEVNIKILVDRAVAEGDLTVKQRNELLVRMTDDVAALVLRDNYLQTQAISLFEAQAAAMLDQQERFMRQLERSGRLNRAVEFLPDDEELARRGHAGRGLTRPEIAVLLAYGKLWLFEHLLESDLPDDPLLQNDLARYFPSAVGADDWRPRMEHHRLRRELVATSLTNSMVNRIGGSIISRLMERTGCSAADVARAYLVVREAFGLREVWQAVEALDLKIPASAQIAMLVEANRLIERGIGWVLAYAPRPLDLGALRQKLEPGIATVLAQFTQVLPTDTAALLDQRATEWIAQGVPEELARRVAGLIVLASANDISRIAARVGRPVEMVGRLYFLVGGRFGLGWLRSSAEHLPGGSHWQKMAVDAVIDDLYGRQAALTASITTAAEGGSAEESLAVWLEQHAAAVARTDLLLAELRTTGKLDLATLIVASHQFQGLSES